MIVKPIEIARGKVDGGKIKLNQTNLTTILLGLMAGMFISYGGIGALFAWGLMKDPAVGKFVGASVFPVGIVLVVLAGGELFTGNNVLTIGVMDKEYSLLKVLKNWSLVYFSNFIGSIFVVGLIYYSGLFSNSEGLNLIGQKAIAVAEGKVSHEFFVVFVRAILCNMLVVLAVWSSDSAKDAIGKVFTLWFPVMLFVTAGFEHVVANMFLIPMGMVLGADISIYDFIFRNIIPATLGNIVGGGIIIPGIYYLAYLKK
jgi:formate/nitrite transporter